MKNTQDKTRIAIIAAMAIFVIALGGYMLWSSSNPTPQELQAQALRSEALAKEYEGESVLVQAKAQLVAAYPATLKEAGLAAVKLGMGALLVAAGVGFIGLFLAMSVSLVIRSSAYAYTDIKKANVLSDLQFSNPAVNPLLAGASDNLTIDHSELFKRADAARTGGGGPTGAIDRYTNRIRVGTDPATAGTGSKKRKRK